eukprot:SAG11_NODE_2271_length_3592_cov_2.874320_2_plen_363_part_00
MVLREWGRSNLHRDIRIEILDSAISMLQASPSDKDGNFKADSDEIWQVLGRAASDASLEPAVKAVLLAADSRRCVSAVSRLAVSSHTTCGALQAQISQVLEKYAGRSHALRSDQALRYHSEVLTKIADSEAAAKEPLLKQLAEKQELEALKKAALEGAEGAAARHQAQKELAAVAKERKALAVRLSNCDDFGMLVLAIMNGFAEPSYDTGDYTLQTAGRLQRAVLEESADLISLEDADTRTRNQGALSLLPTLLVEQCLAAEHTEERRPALEAVLASTLGSLVQRILELPLGARVERHAVYVRLNALHTKMKSSAFQRTQRQSATAMLKEGLKELEWLKEEATDMQSLGSVRVSPDKVSKGW